MDSVDPSSEAAGFWPMLPAEFLCPSSFCVFEASSLGEREDV
jgi:hypothetical protein